MHPELINSRFAYVAVSRGKDDARLFTNDAATMSKMLSQDCGKSSALEMHQLNADQAHKQTMPGLALSL